MKFITVKSKQTTVSVDLVPPLVLEDKQRVSLVDIRIPEQYNARRIRQAIKEENGNEVFVLEISITDKSAYLAAQSNKVVFSEELTKKFDIPRILEPFSVVKISGDEKYFVYCDLVENNNSLLSKDGKTFRLQQSCRVLENLEKEAKHSQVSGKSIKDVSTSCQESAHQQELFRFVSVVPESEQLFLGLACLSPHHLEALVLFVELRVLSPAKPGKRFLGK